MKLWMIVLALTFGSTLVLSIGGYYRTQLVEPLLYDKLIFRTWFFVMAVMLIIYLKESSCS